MSALLNSGPQIQSFAGSLPSASRNFSISETIASALSGPHGGPLLGNLRAFSKFCGAGLNWRRGRLAHRAHRVAFRFENSDEMEISLCLGLFQGAFQLLCPPLPLLHQVGPLGFRCGGACRFVVGQVSFIPPLDEGLDVLAAVQHRLQPGAPVQDVAALDKDAFLGVRRTENQGGNGAVRIHLQIIQRHLLVLDEVDEVGLVGESGFGERQPRDGGEVGKARVVELQSIGRCRAHCDTCSRRGGGRGRVEEDCRRVFPRGAREFEQTSPKASRSHVETQGDREHCGQEPVQPRGRAVLRAAVPADGGQGHRKGEPRRHRRGIRPYRKDARRHEAPGRESLEEPGREVHRPYECLPSLSGAFPPPELHERLHSFPDHHPGSPERARDLHGRPLLLSGFRVVRSRDHGGECRASEGDPGRAPRHVASPLARAPQVHEGRRGARGFQVRLGAPALPRQDLGRGLRGDPETLGNKGRDGPHRGDHAVLHRVHGAQRGQGRHSSDCQTSSSDPSPAGAQAVDCCRFPTSVAIQWPFVKHF